MILGIGGVRLLRALGLAPAVWHINEGHAAFLILELLREAMARGLDFETALEATAPQCVFTTHTPVAAGHDAFDDGLFTACFAQYLRESGLPQERVMQLARAPGDNQRFNMTRLALAGARRVNSVSSIRSGPMCSRSVSRAASPPTSAPRCCCATARALPGSSTAGIARCCCCLRARRIRPISPASRCCARSSS